MDRFWLIAAKQERYSRSALEKIGSTDQAASAGQQATLSARILGHLQAPILLSDRGAY